MIFIVLLICIVLIVLMVIGYKCLQLVVRPIRHTKEESRQAAIDRGFSKAVEDYENRWDCEAFTLDCRDAMISGEIIRNPKAENKVAIICHGHTANRYSALKYARLFYQADYHLLIFDERHFGESTGAYCTLGQNEAKDLSRIIAFAREKFPNAKIALHGESMGAATSLLVLQHEKPDLVIADCPFSDTRQLFREWIGKNMRIPSALVLPFIELLGIILYGYHIRQTSPIEAVRNSDVPICLMHGDNDGLIDCSHSEKLYKACRNSLSELHLFPGADHAQSIVSDPDGYERILNDFLKKCNA